MVAGAARTIMLKTGQTEFRSFNLRSHLFARSLRLSINTPGRCVPFRGNFL